MSEEKEKGVDPKIYAFHGTADGGGDGINSICHYLEKAICKLC